MQPAFTSSTVTAAAERATSKFAEARRLEQEWSLALRDHLADPTPTRLAIRQRAYEAYQAEQRRLFGDRYEQQRRTIGFQQKG